MFFSFPAYKRKTVVTVTPIHLGPEHACVCLSTRSASRCVHFLLSLQCNLFSGLYYSTTAEVCHVCTLSVEEEMYSLVLLKSTCCSLQSCCVPGACLVLAAASECLPAFLALARGWRRKLSLSQSSWQCFLRPQFLPFPKKSNSLLHWLPHKQLASFSISLLFGPFSFSGWLSS